MINPERYIVIGFASIDLHLILESWDPDRFWLIADMLPQSKITIWVQELPGLHHESVMSLGYCWKS